VTFAPWQRLEFTTTGQLPRSRQAGSNPDCDVLIGTGKSASRM
jgi:hypothetical protein